MPTYEKVYTIPASAKAVNAIAGEDFERSGNMRALRAAAAGCRGGAVGDLTCTIKLGTVPVLTIPAGVTRTSGRELNNDDYVPVGQRITPGTQLRVEVDNAQAATRTLILGLMIDGY